MAYAIVNRFASGTEEQYDNVRRVVHPDEGESLPEGQTFHLAGATDDGGWVVIALWDDSGTWERFRDETLLPAFQQVSDGLPGPPDEIGFELRRQQAS